MLRPGTTIRRFIWRPPLTLSLWLLPLLTRSLPLTLIPLVSHLSSLYCSTGSVSPASKGLLLKVALWLSEKLLPLEWLKLGRNRMLVMLSGNHSNWKLALTFWFQFVPWFLEFENWLVPEGRNISLLVRDSDLLSLLL